MVDELIYSELREGSRRATASRSAASPTNAYGFVYPLVIAPAYALFDSLPQAYAAVKAINAVVVSLAALPAYFLARRVLPVGLSLLAALLAVALPSLLYAGQVMTENVFYPLFLCVVLARADARAADGGAPARLLALCVLAYLTRAQALAFFPAIALAPVLAGTWRSFRVLYGALGGWRPLAVLAQLVRGESPLGLLGAYSVTGEHRYEPARGRALAALPRRRARPLRRRRPVRRAARALRALASAAARAAPVPRRDGALSTCFRARGVGVRVAPVGRADRGAQPLLPRAAAADRACSSGSTRGAAAAARGRRRRGGRGGASGRDPVRAPDRRAEPVGHADAAPALAGPRALGVALDDLVAIVARLRARSRRSRSSSSRGATRSCSRSGCSRSSSRSRGRSRRGWSTRRSARSPRA